MEEESTEVKHDTEEERFQQAVADTGRGGGISFVAILLGKGASSGLHVVLARFLGPAGYGLFALGRAVMNIGDSVAKLGTDIGVVRFVSKEDAVGNKLEAAVTFRTALVLATVGSLVVSVALFAGAPFLNTFFEEPGFTPVLRYFALALPAYSLLTVTTSVLQARKYIAEQQGIIRLLAPVLKIVVIGGVFLLGWELRGAVLAFGISGFLSLAISVYIVWARFPELFSLSRWRLRTRRLLRYSLPVLLSGLGSMLAMRVDRILLGSLGTAEGVGIYNVAAIIGVNVSIAKKAIMPVIKPVLSETYEEGLHQPIDTTFVRMYQTATRWMFAATFLTVLPFLVFPEFVLGLFGEGYADSTPVLITFLAFGLAGTVFGPTSAGLKMTGHQDVEFFNSGLLLVSIIVLDLVLIPQYGALGAALGTFLAATLTQVTRAVEIYWYHGFQPFNRAYAGMISAVGGIATTAYYFSTAQPFLLRLVILGISVLNTFAVYYLLAKSEDINAFRSLVTWLGASKIVRK